MPDFKTSHKLIIGDARENIIPDGSVDLVVTSPPYPMVEMWDECFIDMIGKTKCNTCNDKMELFELMHNELEKVYANCWNALKPGGIICINMGDATRTFNKVFCKFPNASITETNLGCKFRFNMLPDIIWKKQTNAPNKFMGSGMLPVGAYVTYEHEYILIGRKLPRREFKSEEAKLNRRESSFFWSERNQWFSDTWNITGTRQNGPGKRERTGAFPFEIPYRLINMFSVYGDTVLDPFCGTGTTTAAAIACGRNSIGVEIDESFKSVISDLADGMDGLADIRLTKRIREYTEFVRDHQAAGKKFKYKNKNYCIQIKTSQESNLRLSKPGNYIKEDDGSIIFEHNWITKKEII